MDLSNIPALCRSLRIAAGGPARITLEHVRDARSLKRAVLIAPHGGGPARQVATLAEREPLPNVDPADAYFVTPANHRDETPEILRRAADLLVVKPGKSDRSDVYAAIHAAEDEAGVCLGDEYEFQRVYDVVHAAARTWGEIPPSRRRAVLREAADLAALQRAAFDGRTPREPLTD